MACFVAAGLFVGAITGAVLSRQESAGFGASMLFAAAFTSLFALPIGVIVTVFAELMRWTPWPRRVAAYLEPRTRRDRDQDRSMILGFVASCLCAALSLAAATGLLNVMLVVTNRLQDR